MNLKKFVSTLLAGVIAVTATLAVATTASAASDVIYLDNYEVKTAKSGIAMAFKEDTQHWSRFTLNSETVVSFQKYENDGSIPYLYDGVDAQLYKLSDSTTTEKFIEKIYKADINRGVSRKLAKGSYAIYWNVGANDDMQYKITWKDKAATTDASAESLTVYIPMETGDKMVLSTAVKPKNAKVTYKSSDKEVLTVTSKGVVKAVGEGTAYVTIKAGKKTVKLYFEVTD